MPQYPGEKKMNKTELEQCIDIYGRDLFAFCRQLTGSIPEAEELYQDTFMTVLEKLHSISMEGNPKQYFISICLRIWKNRQRKFAWRKRIIPMQPFEETYQTDHAGWQPSPEEQAMDGITREYIRKKVASLPDKFRLPLYLYYMEELSVKDISRTLHIPVGTVKSRLHRAKKILRERLEDMRYG